MRLSHLLIATLLSCSALLSHAEKPAEENNGVLQLSQPVRDLLLEEMRAIQEGMMAILPAYSAGDMREITNIARQIQHSYVMKQNLTTEQRHELHSKLPQKFLQMDKRFHGNAGKLADAAEAKDLKQVGFYYTQLSEACAGCHAQYATHQFPHLLNTK